MSDTPMSDVVQRFFRYVQVDTQSADEHCDQVPSTACQFDLANLLADELRALGAEDAYVTESCYVVAHVPASKGAEDKPALGLLAHIDTTEAAPGFGVKPHIVHYEGGNLVAGVVDGNEVAIGPDMLSDLDGLVGEDIICSDGSTLLGGDDKAGVAEIMTMLEQVIKSGIPHGRIAVGFTPDEEIGAGADGFDVKGFGCDFAYTVDGGEEGGIDYENFNAASADFTVHGFNVHPGSSKNTMINASLVAMEINAMLPSGDTPRDTDGYEGFFHLCSMSGNVEKAALEYIVRDHSATVFDARLETLRHIQKLINEKYGEGTAELTIREQYRNMIEMIRPCIQVVDYAKEAIREAGLEPIVEPIRGGTDGARLSYMGLPCPNLGTGGYAAHGPYEHVTVEGMEKCTEILINIVKRCAKA